WSLGMVIGGLVIAAWGGLRNRMAMMMIACLMAAGLTMVMGFMPTIWAFVAVMIAMGFSLPLLQTPLITAIQELIPEAMMGRVMSVVTLVATVCGPLGMAVFGPLADHVSLSWLALVCGAVGVVILGTLALRGGPATRLYPPDRPADESVVEVVSSVGEPGTLVDARQD
ncbi:MAG: MFS transporter, partial [Actinomycetia bacterium]|nr:MFS transporter [Actinomycetes bacterium]